MATIQTVATLLGQVGFNPQGEYQNSRQYARLDVVIHEGSSYACVQDCQGKPVTNTEYWQLIASKGDAYEVTVEDLEEIARAIQEDASSSFNQNVQAKTTEFNQNALSKTTDFNSNATTKTTEFDTNASTKTTNFNSNATSKTSDFNSNATTKTSDFNSNASTKTTEFNTNATGKTTDFDTNATAQTTTFNANVVQKTVDFDNHAEDKTEDFDTNAETKTENFDENASEKTAEFNANFEEKNTMLEKNFNTANKVVTGSGQVTNALYWDAKRVNKFGGGEVTQDTTEGKNKLEIAEFSLSKPDNRTKNVTLQHPIPAGSYYFSWNVVNSTLSDLSKVNVSFRRSDATAIDSCNFSGSRHRLNFSENVERIYIFINSSEADGVAIEVNNMQIEEGTTGTDYEQFTNGASPNPDYAQEVKMLTGNVSVEESNKNILKYRNALVPGSSTKNNGVEFTVNPDGSIHCKGTSSKDFAEIWLNTITFQPGTYTRYYKDNNNNSGVRFQIRRNTNAGGELFATGNTLRQYYGSITKTLDENVRGYCRLAVSNGVTVDETVYPMIEKASTASSYVKNEGQTFPLTLPEGMYLGDLGEASNFIFKNEKNSPYYNSSLVENANYWHKGWNKTLTNISGIDTGTNVNLAKFAKPADYVGYGNYVGYDVLYEKALYGNIASSIIDDTRYLYRLTARRYNNQFVVALPLDTTLEQAQTMLNNTLLCYPLATEENILITDTTLNAQIDTMWEQTKTYGITNFVITGGDISGKLDLDYYVDDRVELESRLTAVEQALVAQNSD